MNRQHDEQLAWERIKLLGFGALFIALLCLATVVMAGEPFTGMPIQINGTPGAVTLIEAENFDKGGFFDPNNCGTAPQVLSVLAPPVAPAVPGDAQKPAIPTGLAGVAVSPTQVNLTWNASTDNVGVVGYWVYLNDAGLVRVTSTSYMHSGLTPGTTYNYRVSAYDAANNHGDWTAVVPVTTPLTAKTCSCPPGAYRPDGVNVCSLGAVNYVSYTDNGLWADYTVEVGATGNYTVEMLIAAAAAAPAVSLTVEGAPNLPLSGVSTRVIVGFISGTPTLVELSRDGMPPFAVWPAGANSTSWLLSSDKKSLSRDWCISAGCWGNVPGPHVLTVKASYGAVWGPSTASVAVNVSDTVAPSSGAQIAGACCATPAYHVEVDGKRYPEAGSYELGITAGWNAYEWRGKSEAIPMVPGIHRLRIVVDQHWFNWDSIRVTFAKGIEWQWVPVWKEYVK